MLPARAKKTNHFIAFFLNPVTGCFWRFKQTPGPLLRCKSRSGLLKHEISLLKGLTSRNLGYVKHLSTGYRPKQNHKYYYWRWWAKLRRLKRITFGFFSRTWDWLCSLEILDSTLWILDPGYWIPDSWSVELGFRIPIVSGIPDSDR